MDKNDLPFIIDNQPGDQKANHGSSPPVTQGKKFNKAVLLRNLPKLILFVLGVVILVELFLGVRTLIQNRSLDNLTANLPGQNNGSSSSSLVSGRVASLSNAKIYLLADKNQYKTGDNLVLRINLDTGGHTINGVDVILRYDPKLLFASSNRIIKGDIFQEYPLSDVDSKNGIVRVSAISSISSKGYNGMGDIAAISFRTISQGDASFSVEFKKGDTTNTNVVEAFTGKNILEEVKNLTVNIN
jgi:hypothetical protein